jgi:hypothetical protein
MIKNEMRVYKESFKDIISITIDKNELMQEFDGNSFKVKGKPFTAWTEKRVYFPTEDDGVEGVASVSRNPDNKATYHI